MNRINIIGNFQDSLNKLDGLNRKFMFNSGTLDAKNDQWTIDILELIESSSFTDWYLSSKDELNAMYEELYLNSIGNFGANVYWSSSEYNLSNAYDQDFSTGTQANTTKSTESHVRPIRSFMSYSIFQKGDTGPAGGWIFAIENVGQFGMRYYEAAPADLVNAAWSNVTNLAITLTTTGIGGGQTNTSLIIAQTGHTNSAAKLCYDLVI
jgi:hypothetical protein